MGPDRGAQSRATSGDFEAAQLKLSVPDQILKKPSALTDAEYDVIKQHPRRGVELLRELGGFSDGVERLVRDHHERLDGRGYPAGRRDGELDITTRILSVCDVYDALVTARVYRDAWSSGEALRFLESEERAAFDQRCVDALRGLVAAQPRDTEDRLARFLPSETEQRLRTLGDPPVPSERGAGSV